MQFNKIRIEVRTSVMMAGTSTVYEHMVPILQAYKGSSNVTRIEDDETCGPVTDSDGDIIDFDLNQEWDRLMERPHLVSDGTTQKAAPLVAFPRGPNDMEDFYARLRRESIQPVPTPEPQMINVPDEHIDKLSLKDQRTHLKRKLDDMGIEYKGNASTDSLRRTYESMSNPSYELEDDDGSSTVQN
jgi:hypothetical protein